MSATFVCEICGEIVFFEDTYGGGSCSLCGQKYYYDEGIAIELTEDQKKMLLAASKSTKQLEQC